MVMMMMKYRAVGRRWEIECIELGMEEIRQIMLSRNGQTATQFDGKYKPNSAETRTAPLLIPGDLFEVGKTYSIRLSNRVMVQSS